MGTKTFSQVFKRLMAGSFVTPLSIPAAPIIFLAALTAAAAIAMTNEPKIHMQDYHATMETCDKTISQLETEVVLITAMQENIQSITEQAGKANSCTALVLTHSCSQNPSLL